MQITLETRVVWIKPDKFSSEMGIFRVKRNNNRHLHALEEMHHENLNL